MKQAPGIRSRRVAQRIRDVLSSSLSRSIDDGRLHDVMITEVTCSDDLGLATVKVRNVLREPDPRGQRRALAALERARGRLRRDLGRALSLERVPELRFVFDSGPDALRRVEELLGEIHREERAPGEGGEGEDQE